MVQVVQYVSLEVLRRLVMRTPVDTGAARANWQVELGVIPSGHVNATDRSGSPTISRGSSIIARLRVGQTVYIVNNLPYIIPLEYGGYPIGPKTVGGFSRQAPRGFVRITAAEFDGMIMQVAARGA